VIGGWSLEESGRVSPKRKSRDEEMARYSASNPSENNRESHPTQWGREFLAISIGGHEYSLELSVNFLRHINGLVVKLNFFMHA
jgi:hypothetical protein